MSELTLFQKLLEIQKEVKGLGKDKQGNGYQYVTGSKVLDKIKPLMIKHEILLKQEIISIENIRQDYRTSLSQNQETKEWTGKPKSEILSKVMMRFTWIDCKSGDTDVNEFGANGQNDWDKGVGSALTYAERYFLLKYFHINTDEDDIDNPERKAEELAEQEAELKKQAEIKEANEKEQARRIEIQLDLDSAGTVEELGTKYTALSSPDKVMFKKYVTTLKEKLTKK